MKLTEQRLKKIILEELEEMIREDEIILEEMNNTYEVLSDDSYYSE